MKPWNVFRFGSIAVLLLSQMAPAQDPAALAAAAGVGPAPVVAAPAAAGPNLFTMLLPPPELAERCRAKICRCGIVKMLRASMAPVSLATGGLVEQGHCCPAVKKEDLAKPADSSEGAAARIKKDLEEAGARRESVRFLGTVDCRYWPEAEDALILALRGDKIECVRFEAALQLQRGCCCTKKIAKALTMVVEQNDKDGFPSERSHRVIDAAAVALSLCTPEERVPEKAIVVPENLLKVGRVDPKEYYKSLDKKSDQEIHEAARKALEQRGPMTASKVLAVPSRAQAKGLFGMIGQAIETAAETPASTAPAVAAQPVRVTRDTQEPTTTQQVSATVSTPVATPLPTQVSTEQPRRGLLYRLLPGLTGGESTTVTASNEPRSVPWTTGSATPVAETQAGFSTASPTPGYATSRSAVYPGSLPQRSPPTPQQPTRQESGGVLGFMTLDRR